MSNEQADDSPPATPVNFWDWPPLRAAFSTHHIGRVSASYRRNPAHGRIISQEQLARWLGRTQGAISRLERAGKPPYDLRLLVHYARILRMPRELLWFDLPDRTFPMLQAQAIVAAPSGPDAEARESRASISFIPTPSTSQVQAHLDATTLSEIEFVRRRIADTLGSGTTTEYSLDDWEQSVLLYGEATRWADPRVLLSSLMADFADLERQLSSRQPTRAQRRLCRLAAQLAGLTSLVLTKAGAHGPARNWARTARLAATEAGDLMTRAWVEAQEAYALFYGGGSPMAAIEAARLAQAVSNGPSVGSALAAALEARAHGILGDSDETLRALERADSILSRLNTGSQAASAFGYNEAQFRFHEGNALTHLGEVDSAWESQKRALALYPINDGDRLLIHLDRAMGLAHSGDARAAIDHAFKALVDVSPDQRLGIVAIRTRQLVNALQPERLSESLANGSVRHLLELTEGKKRNLGEANL